MSQNKNKTLAFAVILVAYFLSSFFKISASVVMPTFQAQMSLSASMVGFISGTYYVSYAFMQIMSGALCRRYGSLKIIALGYILCGTGTFLFSTASESVIPIIAGRFLMGLGMGPTFLAAISFIQNNYSKEQYAPLSGFAVMVCNSGSACASVPLKAMLEVLGIKGLFLLFTVIQILFALFALILQSAENKPVIENNINTANVLYSGLHCITHDKLILSCAILWMLYNSVLFVYDGLWAVKWTSCAFPSFAKAASYSVLFSSIGVVIGSPLSDKIRRKSVSRATAINRYSIAYFAANVLLILSKRINSSQTMLIVSLASDALRGMIAGIMCLQITSLVKEHDSKNNTTIMGLITGIANIAVQIFQWLSGVLLDIFLKKESTLDAFALTFTVIVGFYLVIALISIKLRKKSAVLPLV